MTYIKTGARGGIRTRTLLLAKDFKSSVSTVPPPGHRFGDYTDAHRLDKMPLWPPTMCSPSKAIPLI